MSLKEQLQQMSESKRNCTDEDFLSKRDTIIGHLERHIRYHENEDMNHEYIWVSDVERISRCFNEYLAKEGLTNSTASVKRGNLIVHIPKEEWK